MKNPPPLKNGVTLSELARHYGLEKQSVKTALDAAGIKWTPGPNRSHMYDSAAARAVLEGQRDLMKEIRTLRLALLNAQRELAEQRRDDYNRSHIPVKDHLFVLGHVAAAVHRFIASLELPFPKEIAAGHNLVHEQLEAWRVIGMPAEIVEQEQRELNRARKALEAAIKAGTINDDWMKTSREVREAVYVRSSEDEDH